MMASLEDLVSFVFLFLVVVGLLIAMRELSSNHPTARKRLLQFCNN